MDDAHERSALAAGGLYEVCIGTADLDAALRWWRASGYAPAEEAMLAPDLAERLYGWRSAARAIRLAHASGADHGLVRLWAWEAPSGPGLGTIGLRADGNRWTGQFTRSVMTVANHAAAAIKAGMALDLSEPHFIDMSRAYAHLFGGRAPEPFVDPLVALREVQLFAPEARQVFLERFGYDPPLLGRFADDSLLRATQVVQGSMLVRSDDPGIFGFYERVLGLWKSLDLEVPYADTQASRAVFALREGETHWNVDLDEPASRPTMAGRRSGRLKIFRFAADAPMEAVHDHASPGALGLSCYTWRVKDIEEARRRALAEGAGAVTPVTPDEFGRPAIGLTAPDGYAWVLVEA